MSEAKSTGRKPAEIFIALPRRTYPDRFDIAQSHDAAMTIATSYDSVTHLLSNIPNRRGPRLGSLDQAKATRFTIQLN